MKGETEEKENDTAAKYNVLISIAIDWRPQAVTCKKDFSANTIRGA